jgi:hypothetical protein
MHSDFPPLFAISEEALLEWLRPTFPRGPLSFPSFSLTRTSKQTIRSRGHAEGWRLLAADVAGKTIRDRLTQLVTLMESRGTANPDTIILNPEKRQVLANELMAQGIRQLDGAPITFNTNQLKVAIGGSVLDIVADRHCPFGTAFVLTMKDNMSIVSMGGFPHVFETDGLTLLRSSTANVLEHRLVAYGALLIKKPGECGRCPV